MQKNILVMIQSMTGYGKATAIFGEKKINVEIKSLNSKAMDLSTRIAPLYREKEMEIRNMISKSLERGKVDFSLWIEKDVSDTATPINAALVENYYNQIKSISEMTHIPMPEDWFATLLRMPDVLTKADVQELSEDEWEVVRRVVEEAINHLVDFSSCIVFVVQDTELGMASFFVEVEFSILFFIKIHSPFYQFLDLCRCFSHYFFYSRAVTDPIAGNHRVFNVFLEIVYFQVGNRCYTSLSKIGIGFFQSCFTNQGDFTFVSYFQCEAHSGKS